MLKSLVLQVNNTKLRESAIEAILKSIVAMRTLCDRNPSNMATAPASNGKIGAAENPRIISISRVYPRTTSPGV
ncbi:MAG: hypothetical protein V7K40_02835 [Nostoc sp.]